MQQCCWLQSNCVSQQFVAGSCIREYGGCKDSLLLSIQTMACEYEAGWKFFEAVRTSMQVFSCFRKIKQA